MFLPFLFLFWLVLLVVLLAWFISAVEEALKRGRSTSRTIYVNHHVRKDHSAPMRVHGVGQMQPVHGQH